MITMMSSRQRSCMNTWVSLSLLCFDITFSFANLVFFEVEAFQTTISNSNITRIVLMQGFAVGTLKTFVFLCSPALRHFASCSSSGWGNVDNQGSCEPAYGIIFGAYMAAGVWVA